MNLISSGMRTEINKKRERPSQRSEEARAKGEKQGKNSLGVGGWGGGGGDGAVRPPNRVEKNWHF